MDIEELAADCETLKALHGKARQSKVRLMSRIIPDRASYDIIDAREDYALVIFPAITVDRVVAYQYGSSRFIKIDK